VCPARPKRAPAAPNTAYSRQIMSQNHGRDAPAINPTRKLSLFEVPLVVFVLVAPQCSSGFFVLIEDRRSDGLGLTVWRMSYRRFKTSSRASLSFIGHRSSRGQGPGVRGTAQARQAGAKLSTIEQHRGFPQIKCRVDVRCNKADKRRSTCSLRSLVTPPPAYRQSRGSRPTAGARARRSGRRGAAAPDGCPARQCGRGQAPQSLTPRSSTWAS
jgi:hypothetical protein